MEGFTEWIDVALLASLVGLSVYAVRRILRCSKEVVLPWTQLEENGEIPEVSPDASIKELLVYIACAHQAALRDQLEQKEADSGGSKQRQQLRAVGTDG